MNEHLQRVGRFLASFNEIEAQTYVILGLLKKGPLTK